MTGKVDLVCYNANEKKVKFIELKTGKPNPTAHNGQLRLYGEIFKKSYPDLKNLELELWNSKSGIKSKGFAKIKKLNKYEEVVKLINSIFS